MAKTNDSTTGTMLRREGRKEISLQLLNLRDVKILFC